MNYISEYEARLNELMEYWNSRIDQLKFDAEQAGRELRKKENDEISTLVLNREAARRGLLRMRDTDPCLCASCPMDEIQE